MVVARGNEHRDIMDTRNNMGSVDRFSSNEIYRTREETQASAENLMESSINTSISNVGTKSELMIQQKWLEYSRNISSLSGLLSAIDSLLGDIKDIKGNLSGKGLPESGKKTMKKAKEKLKKYESELKEKKNRLMKQSGSEIYQHDIDIFKNIWKQVGEIKRDASLGQWGYFADSGGYPYYDNKIGEKSNKSQEDTLRYGQKLMQTAESGAFLHIFNGDIQRANDFLIRFNQGEYTAQDYEIYMGNYNIVSSMLQNCNIAVPRYTASTTGYTGGRRLESSPTIDSQTGGNGGVEGVTVIPTSEGQNNLKVESVGKTVRKTFDYKNMSLGEALQKGGIIGCLDKAMSLGNMTSGQKDAWKTAGVLGCIAGGIYCLYKFIKTDKIKFWKKAAITGGVIFGSEFLFGEDPLSIMKKLVTGGWSWDGVTKKLGDIAGNFGIAASASSTESGGDTLAERISPALYSLMVFNSDTKVKEVRRLTQGFKADNKNWEEFYELSCSKLQKNNGEIAEKYFRATFTKEFDEKKRNERLAANGITDATDENESVYGLAGNAYFNEDILEKYMTEHGYKKSKNKGLDEYMQNKKDSNQAVDVDDLDAHKNVWFVRTQESIDNEKKEELTKQVDNLSITREQKQNLKKALETLYDKRKEDSKPNMSFEVKDNLLIVKSHNGNKSQIDLRNNTLISENNANISFSTLSEALDIADLTNYILEITYGKKPDDLPIFEYRLGLSSRECIGKNIYFNNASLFSGDLDTKIKYINQVRNRNTIDRNPQLYANYLSEKRKEANKLNLKNYPLVKQLGIDFFIDENEVKKLENWLEGVKEKLSVYICTKEGNPFSIGKRSKKLQFKREGKGKGITENFFSENIDTTFPTLARKGNHEKFLKALNNPNNKMWGSALS